MSLSNDTGIGITTVKRTIRDYRQKGVVCSPNKKKQRLTIIEKIEDFDKNAIRQKIHGFWYRHEIPTLSKVLVAINEDSSLQLYLVLVCIGCWEI